MIISEQWLREWVQLDLSVQEIADCLTNAGLEVDGIQALGGSIEHLVVGQVTEVAKHPDADRLNITKVDVGNEMLDIVCGASNVAVGLKVAVAMVGATLPIGLEIKKAKVRGLESNGMLCSAAELGLEEASDGILELGDDSVVGQRVDEYLSLDDQLIDIDLTPNRGDCLSVQGIARELKFLADGELHDQEISDVAASSDEIISIELQGSVACPRYLGRVISGIDAAAKTPTWLAERLRRIGVRPISPVVDVTNYVMLELGQPMHAFDRGRLNGGIIVRQSLDGETIKLLDDSEASLDGDTLVIADSQGAIAIAGVMGGSQSAIDNDTTEIVLEAAHFTRKSSAGRARRYGLHTESSHRFERGVDPQLPERAMQRATQLVLEICGGEPGPICEQSNPDALHAKPAVEIRLTRLEQLLGMRLGRGEVNKILHRIADSVQDTTTGWLVSPPSYRFDIEYEADLVEEVARVKGYNNIPTALPRIAPRSIVGSEESIGARQVRQTLVARDFREAITYSFIDPSAQALFSAENPVNLENPLAENMSQMRTSLLPGLLQAAQFNYNRQHNRIRLFEIGASYHHADSETSGANSGFLEKQRLSAVVLGPRHAQQWGLDSEKELDFYDVKGDLEAVLSLTGKKEAFIFSDFEHVSLHPGQVCKVSVSRPTGGELELGFLGRLHPSLEQHYGFSTPVFVFEIDLELALKADLPAFKSVPKFPSIRRDLSLVVDAELAVNQLIVAVQQSLGDALVKANVFDVYQGVGVSGDSKSVSISLILQNLDKTMTDDEADSAVQTALNALKNECQAELRA